MADLIHNRVSYVRRLLLRDRALAVWPWCATTTLAAAAVVIAAGFDRPPGAGGPATIAAAVALSVIAAVAWAWFRRTDELAAAVELDRRCALQERVSSALAVERGGGWSDDVRSALRADAERWLAKADVAGSFRWTASRRLAWPLVPLAAAFAATFLAREPAATSPADSKTAVAAHQVKQAVAALEKKLTEQKALAEKLRLAEAAALLEKVREESRRIAASEKPDRKESLVKLNDLMAQLDERRKTVDGAEQLKRQLARLRPTKGPAEKFTDELRRGRFEAAGDELQKLRRETGDARAGEAIERETSQQLRQLAKQLADLAADEAKQQDDLRRQAAERRQADAAEAARKPADEASDGRPSRDAVNDARPSADELDAQAAASAARRQALERLRQGLSAAAGGAPPTDAGRSPPEDELSRTLEEFASQASEQSLLAGGLQALAACKAGVAEGGPPGGTELNRPSSGKTASPGGGNPAEGEGAGRGAGPAPAEKPNDETPVATFDARVPQSVGVGALRAAGAADGPNAKGAVREAIRRQTAAADERAAAIIENPALDRSRRAQKRQYFDALRTNE